MAAIRPFLGLTLAAGLMLSTALAQNVVPVTPPALPAPAQVNVQANLPALPPAQVKLYRLHNAPADLLAEELYTVFAAQNVRVASDPRTNSVIVGGPPAVQASIAGLIARLDVPQQQAANETFAPAGPAATAGNFSIDGQRTDTARRALELFSGKNALRPGEKIAVVRVSPATARALETVMQPQAGGQSGTYEVRKPVLNGAYNAYNGIPQSAASPVNTITLSHDEIVAMERALDALSKQGANGRSVVVPSDAPATGSREGTTTR